MIYRLVLSLSLTLPLIYGQSRSDTNTIYNVRVDMAEDLPDEDPDAPKIFGWQAWVNKNDPYVQIYGYGTGADDAITVKETTIKEGTETPQWDESFEFNDGDTVGPYTKFLFKIYDDDSTFDKGGKMDFLNLNDPDFLGETREVLVSEIGNCVDNNVLRLPVSRDGKENGLLVVEITKDGCETTARAASGYSTNDEGCLVGDIMYENGDSIGVIGYTCDEDSATGYSGTESYCEHGEVKEQDYNGDCEDEYSGSTCCQEGEVDTYGGAVCITRECVDVYGAVDPYDCTDAGGIEYCEVYTPDGCNTCQCGGACTLMACENDTGENACLECEDGYDLNDDGTCDENSGDECFNAGDIPFCEVYTPDGCNTCKCGGACTLMACENDTGKACLECEDGYNLMDDGTCECGKDPGDDCETDEECCDHYCIEVGGRKQCYLE